MHPAPSPLSFAAKHLPNAWPFFAEIGALANFVNVVFLRGNGLRP